MMPPDRQALDRPPGDTPALPDGTPALPDVARVTRGGPGPLIVAALVAGALVVGLARPWDWLGPSSGGAGHEPGSAGRQAGPGDPVGPPGTGDGAAGGDPAAASGGSAAAPFRSPTCASPLGWRAATRETWTGNQVRVWTAAEAVPATGPGDAAIPFRPIVADAVTAIGWCAPVEGAERPPLAATATLFRLGMSGRADEIPYERLEPTAPDAMGELLVPPVQSVGRRPAWAPGRYVIRLATPSGSYVRYLGLEVTTVAHPASPAPATRSPAGG